MPRTVIVCQNQTCNQQGAEQVLSALQASGLGGIDVEASGCLGQCGSGPMVLILPEKIWYCHVHSRDVPELVEQHLTRGKVVRRKLYPKFHPRKPIGIWLVAMFMALGTIAIVYWTVITQFS